MAVKNNRYKFITALLLKRSRDGRFTSDRRAAVPKVKPETAVRQSQK
jgi:hypothetical protein